MAYTGNQVHDHNDRQSYNVKCISKVGKGNNAK